MCSKNSLKYSEIADEADQFLLSFSYPLPIQLQWFVNYFADSNNSPEEKKQERESEDIQITKKS